MEYPIVVNYEYTSNTYKAMKWLEALADPFAADFEVASVFTAKDKALMKYRLENFDLSREEQRIYTQRINSDGLSHPSLTVVTHLSVACSKDKGYVIVCDNDSIREAIFRFLTTTDKTQLWHNASYDWKRLLYHMGKFPKNFVDTLLLAKCLSNDCNPFRDRVGLKELMAYAYGSWAVAKEVFTLEEMWKPETIKYAATDSCAGYLLFQDLMEEINDNKWSI